MKIIGISAFYHDSAAALIINGEIINAAQEERFSRIKHDSNFPHQSINFILNENNLNIDDIDYIAFYEKPFLKFERIVETYLSESPKGFKSFSKSLPIWINEKLFQKRIIFKELKKLSNNFNIKKILFCEHHLSHAASAFYPSPFKDSIILTLDGVGEWTTSSIALGKNNKINIVKELHFPHSLGLLYSAFTYYLGFKVNSGEYKVMGLAPYGEPKYVNIILEKLINLKEDGSFHLNLKYFDYVSGLKMINNKFSLLFGQPKRISEKEEIKIFHMDIAASIQKVIELIILKICKNISNEYKIPNLCLAGGVALNCVANEKILKNKLFKDIWIQPASGDAGGAIGSALYTFYGEFNNKRKIRSNDSMKGSLLGPSFNNDQILKTLKKFKAKFEIYDYNQISKLTAKYISEGKAIGLFQGKMEFGPRALGCRSIIADPRSFEMQKKLNLKIKYRESFRPFAPSILIEDKNDWFDLKYESPYMLLVSNVKESKKLSINTKDEEEKGLKKLQVKRSKIPAVTHVDYSSRIQTVNKDTNPLFYSIISEFKKLTGCPIVVNTSFNIRGEPIVCNPEDAYNCFMGTNLDVLIIENYILLREKQNFVTNTQYLNKFELD